MAPQGIALPERTKMETFKAQQAFLEGKISEAIASDKREAFWSNFNVNRQCPARECRSRFERLMYRLHRRLFRSPKYAHTPTSVLMAAMGTLERGSVKEHPHVHAVIWIDSRAAGAYSRLAGRLWQNLSPGGGFYIDRIDCPRSSAPRIAKYISKDLDRAEYRDGFFTELDLGLPLEGGPIAPRTRQPRETS